MTNRGLEEAVCQALENEGTTVAFSEDKKSNLIRVRTGRNWPRRLGLSHKKSSKDVDVDDHERKNVFEYRFNLFIPGCIQFRGLSFL